MAAAAAAAALRDQGGNKVRDLLLSADVPGQVELLLNLLNDAASGKEQVGSNTISEVIQVRDCKQA